MKPKLIRITTVPISMNIILRGQLHFMNQYFDVVGISGYHEKHFNEIKEREGVRMYQVEMKRSISPVNDIISFWKLFWLFRKEKPQIVHSHTPKAGFLSMAAAWFAGVPVRLHTIAGLPLLETSGIKRTILNIVEKVTCLFANKLYPNSYGLRDIIIDNRLCAANKLKVIGSGSSNGIDIENFNPDYREDIDTYRNQFRTEIGISDKAFVFCFVGRIAREKGVKELIDAFLRLQKEKVGMTKWGSVQLIFVGIFEKEYGALDAYTQQIILSNDNIKFVGRHDDIRPYLAISNAFVLPTYREGFPNAVLQAGAMGLPSIVTDINGCNEIIINNKNGILIQPKDTVALYEAMKNLLLDDTLRTVLAGNARNMIVERYKQDVIWKQILLEYQTQIANNV